jgi:hypothetical protein
MCMQFTGFSLDIGATVVGITTVYIIGRQMFDQRKLNQRIADMQYAKLIEDKLLAIVYSGKYNAGHKEIIYSAPSMEWYKFNLCRVLLWKIKVQIGKWLAFLVSMMGKMFIEMVIHLIKFTSKNH